MSSPQGHQTIITDTNLTPVVQIITWVTLTTTLCAFLAHAWINIYVTRALSIELAFVFLSVLFSGGQSIAVSIQASKGFGKPFSSLSPAQVASEQKAEYAAILLFLLVLALSKLALVAFIWALTPSKKHHTFDIAIGTVVLLWLVASVFAAAFQCPLPQPWDYLSTRCMNRTTWWYATSILNAVLEIALVGLEYIIILPLEMQSHRKATILSIFSCRLLVILATAIQLYFFHLDITGPLSADRTLGYWRSTIAVQIVMCLATVTTSLPYAKILMDSLNSGMIVNDDLRRRGKDYSVNSSYIRNQRSDNTRVDSGGKGYLLLDVSRSKPKSNGSAGSFGGESIVRLRNDAAESEAIVSAVQVPGTPGRVGGISGIKETKSWTVERI